MASFIKHISCEKCSSKDNFALYRDSEGNESGHCFGCSFTIPSKEHIEANEDKNKKTSKVKSKVKDHMEKDTTDYKPEKIKDPISNEVKEDIKARTSQTVNKWRNINNSTCKHYGIRAEYSETTGELEVVYYPVMREGVLCGFKKRVLPKSFSGIGDTTATTELFGQFRYKNKQEKYCLITEGEQCSLAAFQMIKDYNEGRGKDFGEPVVVGITTGAQSAHKQVAANYSFFEGFSKVIIAMDQDKPGQDAVEKIAKALPRGKAFIFSGALKDCAEYLEKGEERDFIRNFYNAKPWTPVALHSSTELYAEALNYADLEKIALPSWLGQMNDMLAGGIPKATLTLIAAGSSIGKSTVNNQLLVDWLMMNKAKPEERKEVFAVLSLEATAGEFATQLLSYYCKQKFINIPDREERVKAMSRPEVAAKAKELFEDTDGKPSFLLCDDRGSSIDDVEAKIEEIIRSMGVTVLIIDVTSDLLSGVEIGRQEEFMSFQKRLVKETGVAIINVVHTRKTDGGARDTSRGAEITDSSIIGSSTLVKSASVVIGLIRDKMADSEVERNTTHLRLLKSRHAGATGNAGSLYYDAKEHRLVPLDDWLEANGSEF
jgi:twinkle protein